MTNANVPWLHRILAIVIGHVTGTVIFIAGPIAIQSLQGYSIDDTRWMLENLPQFIALILAMGVLPSVLLAAIVLRRTPAIWTAIILGVVLALFVMFASSFLIAFQVNIWQPIFLHTLFMASLDQLLPVIVSGAVGGLVAWCYLMLTRKRPPPRALPGQLPEGTKRTASTYTVH